MTYSYDVPLRQVLADLASDSAVPGSGACCALAVSLAHAALTCHLRLTVSRGRQQSHGTYHDALAAQLANLEATIEGAYNSDCVAFAGVVDHRRRRDSADDDAARRKAVSLEVEQLNNANASLLTIARAASTIAVHAEEMYSSKGHAMARGESAAAKYLAQAAINACADILALNLQVLARRLKTTSVSIPSQVDVASLLPLVRDSGAQFRLERALAGLNAV